MVLLSVYVVATISLSFLCSLLEAVLLSVTPSYLAHASDQQQPFAQHLAAQKAEIERPLTAILSLNTIAHTVGAAGVGAQAQLLWGSRVLALASAVLTLLMLVLSEIIPKTLGAAHWRKLAPWTAHTLRWLVWAMAPFVGLSQRMTRRLRPEVPSDCVDHAQLAALVGLGVREGSLRPAEAALFTSLLAASPVRTREIMTPRPVVAALSEACSVQEAVERHEVMRFSRIPVWRQREEEFSGFVLKDELLLLAAQGRGQARVGDVRRRLAVVPDSLEVAELFQGLLDRREHIALVVDEYGSTVGIVSMEDVVETLLGAEIVDEADATHDMRDLARMRWNQRAQQLGLLAKGGAR